MLRTISVLPISSIQDSDSRYDQNTMNGSNPRLNIAIIGAGIVGAHVAIGLLHRNIQVTIYEQSSQVKEIGAGIAFPTPIVDCMTALDPAITEQLQKVSGVFENLNAIDGCSDEDLKLRPADKLFDVVVKPFSYHSAHRAQLLDGLLALIPPEHIKLGKRLEAITQKENNEEPLLLQFSDGTTAEADAGMMILSSVWHRPFRLKLAQRSKVTDIYSSILLVIACDGIKSQVRRIVLGNDDPAAFPHYSYTSAYRGLVPMEKAEAALGKLSKESATYLGQGASLFTYPIVSKNTLNVAAFVHDEGEWPDSKYLTIPGKKEDVVAAFSRFGPSVRDLVAALPEELNRWAIFDSFDHPLSTFAYGRIVLAGDAAHASTPHHGAGAGMGIEDALVMATLLKKVAEAQGLDESSGAKNRALEAAFRAYDSVRRERGQWVVSSSRFAGKAAQGRNPGIGSDPTLWAKDISERINKVFSYDWKSLLVQAIDEYERQLGV
jgi:salicylate hydroxylase